MSAWLISFCCRGSAFPLCLASRVAWLSSALLERVPHRVHIHEHRVSTVELDPKFTNLQLQGPLSISKIRTLLALSDSSL